ncbi:MAG: tetratricopeptide repeat protein, partial [Mailhella sp.]|nr:tetratricopeptide repeat protein [Mailhella sp.]
IALWADLLIQQNEREKAIGILESFAGRHPDDAQAQAELALALLRSARAEDAMSVFKKIPADKLTPQIRFSYAQALSAERRFQEAEKQLSAAVEEDPEYSEAWQLLALTLEEQGRAREAMTIYTRLLGEDPDNRSARLFLLRYHLRSGNTENAISVVAESQDPLRFAVAASAILLEEKQYAQAESLMSSLTRLPDMPADLYFYYAALLYEGGGDLDRALQFLTLVPADGEEHDKVLRLRVRILCELKRFPEAVSALRELLQVHPDDFESTMLLAELLIRQENFEEAGSLLTKVVAAQPDNENALLQQALLKEMQGKRDEAMVLMEKLIVKFPENAMALNFIGYNLADRGVELDRALDLIQRALESEPDADFIVDSLAWAHFRRGELDLAWKHIQRAVSLANQKGNVDPAMIEHLGDIAKARGDRARAKQAWQQSMELFLKFNFKDDADRVREKLKKVQP